jgi:hypothetical protein
MLQRKKYILVLLIKIRNGLDTSLIYHQTGFRSERATEQHVIAARRLLEEINDSSKGTYLSTLGLRLSEMDLDTYCTST